MDHTFLQLMVYFHIMTMEGTYLSPQAGGTICSLASGFLGGAPISEDIVSRRHPGGDGRETGRSLRHRCLGAVLQALGSPGPKPAMNLMRNLSLPSSVCKYSHHLHHPPSADENTVSLKG